MSRIKTFFPLAVIACVVWVLLIVCTIHWSEDGRETTIVTKALEEAEKKLHDSLNFRLDNFDARNKRQLYELKAEVQTLKEKVDKLLHHPSELKQAVHSSDKQDFDNNNNNNNDGTVVAAVSERQEKRSSDLKSLGNVLSKTAVLLITCNRVDYLKRTLGQLLAKQPADESLSVVVSQDCSDAATSAYLQQFSGRLRVLRQPDLSPIKITNPKERNMEGYYKISRHYKYALGQIFDVLNFDFVIIVEDDLDIADDFFSYFLSTRQLLLEDPSIWCVSAWNDNGKENYVSGNDVLYRSDFFPGLGWMMSKSLWAELGPKWPASYWDDWMREPAQRSERVCIRPEVCRTKTFGYKGVSKGEFSPFLKMIKLNDRPVNFSTIDLSYLHKERYNRDFLAKVYAAPELPENEVILGSRSELQEIRVTYSGQKQFETLGKRLGVMTDWKAGIPRGAYKGVVTIFFRNRRLYIAPPKGS